MGLPTNYKGYSIWASPTWRRGYCFVRAPDHSVIRPCVGSWTTKVHILGRQREYSDCEQGKEEQLYDKTSKENQYAGLTLLVPSGREDKE